MASGPGLPDEEALNIYTDGSSYPYKKRVAGVGVRFVWVNDAGDEEIEDYVPIGWQQATADEMEIEACVVALKQANRLFQDMSRFKRILIFSDSRYVTDNYFRAMHLWPKRAWRKANGTSVENIEIWKRLKREVNACPIPVDVKWVKGHKSNIHNRAADKLAKASALMPFQPAISISATTRKWSDRKTIRGCIPVVGQELKIRIVSREYKRRAKIYEYRYEVIDPADRSYKDVDFVRYSEALSRNKCVLVRLNTDQNDPRIAEVLGELNPAEYKY